MFADGAQHVAYLTALVSVQIACQSPSPVERESVQHLLHRILRLTHGFVWGKLAGASIEHVEVVVDAHSHSKQLVELGDGTPHILTCSAAVQPFCSLDVKEPCFAQLLMKACMDALEELLLRELNVALH